MLNFNGFSLKKLRDILVFPFVNGSGKMFGMVGRTSIRVKVVFWK